MSTLRTRRRTQGGERHGRLYWTPDFDTLGHEEASDVLGAEAGSDVLGPEAGGTDILGAEEGSDILGPEEGGTDELRPQ